MSRSAAEPFHAVVLAGERPGGSALARELGIAANVLAPLAGRACISRVVGALRASRSVCGGLLCGPDRSVVRASPALTALLSGGDYRWLAPRAGPAASALAGVAESPPGPILLTTGDHGLLDAAIVDAFCARAWAERADVDVLVGLVPYPRVREAFPDSRRTRLRFADGTFCGSNLFALLTPHGGAALRFWSGVEADRKRPWRIARRLGAAALLGYLGGTLTVGRAFARLSERAGCRIGWVPVEAARAAVDVDSMADWQLADALLRGERGGGP